MAQMLARLPQGGGPAGGAPDTGAEEPSAASVGTAADEGATQAPSDTADRHMAQMLARLPQGGGPDAAKSGPRGDEKPSVGPPSPVDNKQLSARSPSPPGNQKPPPGSPSPTDDRPADRPGAPDNAPSAASPNLSNPHGNRPRNRPDKPGISSWGPPFQDLFDAAQKPAFQPGQSIGRYIVLEELGAGAMGAVLKAYDAQLDRAIAIKLLHTEGNQDDTARLQREAQALAKLSHPNVIQVHDVGEIDGQTFIAMELVKGQTLREWMEEPEQPRPWRECLNVYVQAGAGLAAAHDAGLIHRDFKPDNAIVDAKGQVRVLDFGMARRTLRTHGTTNAQSEHHDDRPADLAANDLALEASITNPGTIMGTPLYMPPEQWRGEEAGPHSDQFSFCVALYEALYGARPFAGKTIYELMDTIAEGRIAPLDSKGPVVPSRVRNIVVRGLSPDHEQRWPSMDDLLTELRQLAAPPGRRYMARAVAVGLAAMAGNAGFLGYLEMKDRCTGALAQMDGIWDESRRQAVETAILGTELSYAPGTWTRVEQRLDDYADAWTDKHTEVCEATSVRGEQSEEAMRLRMRCLSKRRTSLRASVDELTNANAKTVENAVELVAGLPTLTLCDDLTRLEQQDQLMPPPEDPDVAAEVEVLRERLADIKAMREAGRYVEALEMVEPVMKRAEALNYPPLLAEALYGRGVLRDRNGQYVEAEGDLREAHTLAVEFHHDPIALDTTQALTFVVGYQLARHIEGRQWGEMEALPLALRSDDQLEEANSLNKLGVVFAAQGDYESARNYHERALAIKKTILGSESLSVASGHDLLGRTLRGQGDYENARIHHQHALAIKEIELGPQHPDVATTLDGLGLVLFIQGDYENASVYHQSALIIKEASLGPTHPDVALSLRNLGNVFMAQGDYESAETSHRRALEIQKKALNLEHPDVALSLMNLGNTFAAQGDYGNASFFYQRALETQEKALGFDHSDLALTLLNLGNVFSCQGDYENARIHLQRALKIQENALGPEHPDVAASLGGLGVVLRMQGDVDQARLHHQRALAIYEKALGPDHLYVAQNLNNLGLVFYTQGDYENARIHYQRALATLEKVLARNHLNLAPSLGNLGIVFYAQGDYENARVYHQRAQEILEKALGPDHPNVAYPLVGLAEVALKIRDLASARAYAERAVSIRKASEVGHQLLAEARFVLARALWSERSERARARSLAEQARDALVAAEGPGNSDVELDEVDAWLATHRVK
ncbi:MAG: tetratricopeptide repeat protein [Myxococcota bacterium]